MHRRATIEIEAPLLPPPVGRVRSRGRRVSQVAFSDVIPQASSSSSGASCNAVQRSILPPLRRLGVHPSYWSKVHDSDECKLSSSRPGTGPILASSARKSHQGQRPRTSYESNLLNLPRPLHRRKISAPAPAPVGGPAGPVQEAELHKSRDDDVAIPCEIASTAQSMSRQLSSDLCQNPGTSQYVKAPSLRRKTSRSSQASDPVQHINASGFPQHIETWTRQSSETVLDVNFSHLLQDRGLPQHIEIWARCAARSKSSLSLEDIERLNSALHPLLNDTFARFSEGDGSLNRDHLFDAMAHLGYTNISPELCYEMLIAYPGISKFDYEDFVQIVMSYAELEGEMLKKEFEVYLEGNGGALNVSKCAKLLSMFGIVACKRELEQLVRISGMREGDHITLDSCHRLIAIFRAVEGFVLEGDIQNAIAAFDSWAEMLSYRQSGQKFVLAISNLKSALLQMFGTEAVSVVDILLHSIACTDRGTFVSITFREFLAWARRVREHDRRDLWKLFQEADLDGGGTIDKEELTVLMRKLGFVPVCRVVEELIEEVCGGNCEDLDLDNFMTFMRLFRERDGFTQTEAFELRAAFTRFGNHANGELDRFKLLRLLRHLGYDPTLEKVNGYIKEFGNESRKTLNIQQYFHMMRRFRDTELNIFLAENRVFESVLNYLEKLDIVLIGDALEMMKEAFNNQTPLTFDSFVTMVDRCREMSTHWRRKWAQFTEDEITNLQVDFEQNVKNDFGLAKERLPTLLARAGVPLHRLEIRTRLRSVVADAWQSAIQAGWSEQEIGDADRPYISFQVFLFVLRNLADASEEQRYKRELQAISQADFSPAEVEEFREIFSRMQEEQLSQDGNTCKTETANLKTLQVSFHSSVSVEEFSKLVGPLLCKATKTQQFDFLRFIGDVETIEFSVYLRAMRRAVDYNLVGLN